MTGSVAKIVLHSLMIRRSSGVEGEMLEEEEFVGTGEVVRIEKTEEVIIILVVIIAAIF